MIYNDIEIKKGIRLHTINTEKFKTNLIAVFLTTNLNRENVTKDTLLLSVLKRGSKNMKTQEEISKKLEEMYGASFDCGIDKTGDNHTLKFYFESINDNFIDEPENLLESSIDKILEIIFNPLTEGDSFKEEYVNGEKHNIRQLIESKIDNKAKYALNKCIETMYKDKPYGLYRYGYTEDLENIDAKELYEYYKQLIKTCKIDIFVSGLLNDNITNIILNNENISKLEERNPDYKVIKVEDEAKEVKEENIVTESMDIVQGKLVLGLDVNLKNDEEKYITMLYNSILGGTANSKMFQNVREKASLAYTASSSYTRPKNNIFIIAGIEINNYEKALNIIKEQIEDMKRGNFTEEDIDNAKKSLVSTILSIEDEQDSEITYFYGQELTENKIYIDEYLKKVQNVQKSQIIDIANRVSINTIFFLKD